MIFPVPPPIHSLLPVLRSTTSTTSTSKTSTSTITIGSTTIIPVELSVVLAPPTLPPPLEGEGERDYRLRSHIVYKYTKVELHRTHSIVLPLY